MYTYIHRFVLLSLVMATSSCAISETQESIHTARSPILSCAQALQTVQLPITGTDPVLDWQSTDQNSAFKKIAVDNNNGIVNVTFTPGIGQPNCYVGQANLALTKTNNSLKQQQFDIYAFYSVTTSIPGTKVRVVAKPPNKSFRSTPLYVSTNPDGKSKPRAGTYYDDKKPIDNILKYVRWIYDKNNKRYAVVLCEAECSTIPIPGQQLPTTPVTQDSSVSQLQEAKPQQTTKIVSGSATWLDTKFIVTVVDNQRNPVNEKVTLIKGCLSPFTIDNEISTINLNMLFTNTIYPECLQVGNGEWQVTKVTIQPNGTDPTVNIIITVKSTLPTQVNKLIIPIKMADGTPVDNNCGFNMILSPTLGATARESIMLYRAPNKELFVTNNIEPIIWRNYTATLQPQLNSSCKLQDATQATVPLATLSVNIDPNNISMALPNLTLVSTRPTLILGLANFTGLPSDNANYPWRGLDGTQDLDGQRSSLQFFLQTAFAVASTNQVSKIIFLVPYKDGIYREQLVLPTDIDTAKKRLDLAIKWAQTDFSATNYADLQMQTVLSTTIAKLKDSTYHIIIFGRSGFVNNSSYCDSDNIPKLTCTAQNGTGSVSIIDYATTDNIVVPSASFYQQSTNSLFYNTNFFNILCPPQALTEVANGNACPIKSHLVLLPQLKNFSWRAPQGLSKIYDSFLNNIFNPAQP